MRTLKAEWTNGMDVDYCDCCNHPFHKYSGTEGADGYIIRDEYESDDAIGWVCSLSCAHDMFPDSDIEES